MNSGDLLTPAEAAPLLRHSEFTVWRWCKTGTLLAVRIGRKWFIPSAEVERIYRDGTMPKPGPKSGSKHRPRVLASISRTMKNTAAKSDQIVAANHEDAPVLRIRGNIISYTVNGEEQTRCRCTDCDCSFLLRDVDFEPATLSFLCLHCCIHREIDEQGECEFVNVTQATEILAR